MSVELRLIVAPRQTYAALVRRASHTRPAIALRRPLLVALVFGLCIAIASTHTVTPALVVSTTLSWSYIVLLQLAIAVPLIAAPARRTVGMARAIDLFFAGHAPWSLFMLFVAAWSVAPASTLIWPLYVAALVPCVLTLRIVSAFFSEVLALDPGAARRRTIVQQAMTWTIFVGINWAASAFTPRLVESAWRR